MIKQFRLTKARQFIHKRDEIMSPIYQTGDTQELHIELGGSETLSKHSQIVNW